MCIEDPFDPSDNVARSVTELSVKVSVSPWFFFASFCTIDLLDENGQKIRLEFIRANCILTRTGDFERQVAE